MKSPYLIILGLIILFIGCKKNKVYSPTEQITDVELSFSGLQSLGDSCWYEGWLVWGEENENKQTTGIFQVDAQGNLSPSTFRINLGQAQLTQKFLLTIEEDDVPGYVVTKTETVDTVVYDSVEGPGKYKIMAGIFQGNMADLSVGNLDISEDDFTQAKGTYLLNTPTDSNNANPKSGIWFIDKDSLGSPIQGLQIPSAGGGWTYDGIVEINSVSVSTGTFRNPGGPDDSNQYSDSTGVPPPFPGEDFLFNAPAGLTFPVDLSGANVSITLDAPYPDGCNSPFGPMVPLQTIIPGNATPGTVDSLENSADNFPWGRAVLNIQIYETN